MSSSYLTVGHVSDAHGIKGELYIYLSEIPAPWLVTLKSLRLTHKGQLKELDLIEARPHRHGFIAKLKNLNDRTEAESLKQWKFEIPAALLQAPSGSTPYLYELLGFHIYQRGVAKAVGQICGFQFNGAHDLLVVTAGEESIEIPFVEALVDELNMREKRLVMHLPDEFFDPRFWRQG